MISCGRNSSDTRTVGRGVAPPAGRRATGRLTDDFRPARGSRVERRSEGGSMMETGRLGRLATFTSRHRWPVIAAWVVLTLIGGVAAGKLSSRWYQSFSIPGKSAYEASQRTLTTFGVGIRPPNVVVFHTNDDATKSP